MKRALQLTVVFAAYLVTAQLGLGLGAVSGFATLVWPPTGIAIFALLKLGTRAWPAVFAAAFLANLLNAAPPLVAAGIGLGNTAEAVLAALLLAQLGFDHALGRVRDVGKLILVSFAAAAVSATVGVASLWAGGVVSVTALVGTWKAWSLGDALGALTVAPLLLVWSRPASLPGPRRVLEAALMCAGIALLAFVVFAGAMPKESPFGWPYLVFPALFWAAVRFTQRGAVTATFLVSCVAITATALGLGPFARETLSESLVFAQVFMGISAVAALTVAASVSERDQSQRKFAAMFESSPFAIGLVKIPTAVIADVNPAFVKMLEVPRDEAVGKTCVELGLHCDLEAQGAETQVSRRSGRSMTVSSHTASIELAGEHYRLLTLEDTTERHRAEEALREALRVREEFFAIAGHELNTPLAVLLLQVQGLQRALKSGSALARLEERLDKAAAAGLRLEELIEEMLDVSRIASGRLELHPEPLELRTLVAHVAERFGDPARQAGSSLSLHLEVPARGTWDRSRLDQVVSNLLSNAIKYGRGRPIDVVLREEQGAALLRVVDRGVGIALNDQSIIFERFERAAGTRDFGGFGLGLWISRRIVEACGGQIEVESKVGEGATFTVRLPLQPGEVSGVSLH